MESHFKIHISFSYVYRKITFVCNLHLGVLGSLLTSTTYDLQWQFNVRCCFKVNGKRGNICNRFSSSCTVGYKSFQNHSSQTPIIQQNAAGFATEWTKHCTLEQIGVIVLSEVTVVPRGCFEPLKELIPKHHFTAAAILHGWDSSPMTLAENRLTPEQQAPHKLPAYKVLHIYLFIYLFLQEHSENTRHANTENVHLAYRHPSTFPHSDMQAHQGMAIIILLPCKQ